MGIPSSDGYVRKLRGTGAMTAAGKQEMLWAAWTKVNASKTGPL